MVRRHFFLSVPDLFERYDNVFPNRRINAPQRSLVDSSRLYGEAGSGPVRWEPPTSDDAQCDFLVIPYLDDNYSYVVKSKLSNVSSQAIDAGLGPVLMDKALNAGFPPIQCLFTTHRHLDHSAGNEPFMKAFPSVNSFGTHYEIVPGRNQRLEPGSTFCLTESCKTRSIFLKSHTKASLGFFVYDDTILHKAPLLFTGDAIFCAGAGKFIEGHVKDMAAIVERLRKFPQNTLVFPGHEFTEPNLRFAAQVEPDNPHIKERLAVVQRLRAQGLPTVPSTLEMEFLTNPFLRAMSLKRLQVIRQAKDKFDEIEGIDHE
eukprot:GHVN01056801.1.p1 GENE.GHVN01056801.1~~GHVN01056801.1.p1  ORF type:complete len:316 (-),score=28.31 GHVN01056801.1:834-1781(-)